jgi:hypothetical protein
MAKSNESFLHAAIGDTANYKGYKGDVGTYILSFSDGTTDIDDLFFEAFVASLDDDSLYNELAILGYMQTVMDKVCWNARKLFTANNKDSDIYGVDPSERVAELVEVKASNKQIPGIIADDYKTLLLTQAECLQALGTDLVMDLYYFSPSEPDDITGEWTPRCKCMSFDEALAEMSIIQETLDEKKRTTVKANLLQARAARKAA